MGTDETLFIDFPAPLDSLNKEFELDIQWSDATNGNYLGLWNFPIPRSGFVLQPLELDATTRDFILDFVVYS